MQENDRMHSILLDDLGRGEGNQRLSYQTQKVLTEVSTRYDPGVRLISLSELNWTLFLYWTNFVPAHIPTSSGRGSPQSCQHLVILAISIGVEYLLWFYFTFAWKLVTFSIFSCTYWLPWTYCEVPIGAFWPLFIAIFIGKSCTLFRLDLCIYFRVLL